MMRMKTLSAAFAVAAILSAPVLAQSRTAIAEEAEAADGLLAELATPGLATFEAVEQRLLRLWSQSGSDTADLLLQRGRDAMEADDYMTAVEHLTALTDHAPDFAEGWHARAQAWFQLEEYGLAINDLMAALSLNPNHFAALTGLGVIYEEIGRPKLALSAIEEAHRLNPNSEATGEARERLRLSIGAATL